MRNLFLAWSWTACNDGFFFFLQLISLIKMKRCDVDVLDVRVLESNC